MNSVLRRLGHRLLAAGLRSDAFSRGFAQAVLDADRSREVTVRGCTLRFCASSAMINEQLCREHGGRTRFEAAESETLDFLDRHLADGGVFYDIGANFGFYVAYAARRAKLAHIVALEPESLNFAELCRNIQRNALGNVTALGVAAGASTALVDYHLRSFVPGNHSGRARGYLGAEFIDHPRGEDRFLEGYRQPLLLMPLDELRRIGSLPAPTVLLMDIDGGELQALAGMRGTLAEESLRALVIETGGGADRAPVHDFLAPLGWRCIRAGGSRRENEFFERG